MTAGCPTRRAMLGDMGYNSDMPVPGKLLAPLALAALIAALMFVPLPFGASARHWPGLTAELQNFGHPLAFALLGYCAFAPLRARFPRSRPAPYLWIMAGAAVFGLATEALQALFDRQASWPDLLNDLAGAGIALLLHARQEFAPGRVLLAAALVLALAVAAPLMVSAAAYAIRASLGPGVIWRAGTPLSGHFAHWQHGEFPGLVIDEPIADWRDWEFLEIDVESLESTPLRVFVRAHDLVHEGDYPDRFNGSYLLQAGARQLLRIPVERIGAAPATRRMDIAAIRGMIVFGRKRDPAHRFLVHEIRLAGRHGQVLVPSRP